MFWSFLPHWFWVCTYPVLTGLKSCGLGFWYDPGGGGYFPVLTNISSASRASGGLYVAMKCSLLWRCGRTGGRNIPVLLVVFWGPSMCKCVFVSFLWGTAGDLYSRIEKSGGRTLHTSPWLAASVGANHLLLASESCWLAENLILSSKQTEDSGCSKLRGTISTDSFTRFDPQYCVFLCEEYSGSSWRKRQDYRRNT